MYIASVFRVLKRIKLTSVYFIKHAPAFHNAGGHKNSYHETHKQKYLQIFRLQRYYKFLIYTNFARKIW